MPIVAISTKGQIVIPKQIREILGLRPGTKMKMKLDGEEIRLILLKENISEKLYGKYRDVNLLGDLEQEHGKEVQREVRQEVQ